MASSDEEAEAGSFDPAHDETQLERMTFFSDAVFAIAMTLLVVEVRLPAIAPVTDRTLGVALVTLIPRYSGFLASFLVIGRFWIGHHQLFGLLDGTSNRLLWTNLLFLLAIAFMPFPTAVFSEYLDLRTGVAVYAGWLTLVGALNWLLVRTALGGDGRLVKPGAPSAQIVARRQGARIPLALGAIAFAAGMVSPWYSVIALAVAGPLVGWLARHWR
jgi:uncharacterized membrane protein